MGRTSRDLGLSLSLTAAPSSSLSLRHGGVALTILPLPRLLFSREPAQTVPPPRASTLVALVTPPAPSLPTTHTEQDISLATKSLRLHIFRVNTCHLRILSK